MHRVPSTWRKVLVSLLGALLVACCAPVVAAVAAYVMAPPRADPDPAILVILAALTLGPSIALGLAAERAGLVSGQWDLGKAGTYVLLLAAYLLAAILGGAGLYSLARFVELVAAR